MEKRTIGNKIANLRKEKNISQSELAEELFISHQAVGKWERGESFPDINTLNRLAEIFNVDLNFFSENYSSVTKDGATLNNADHGAQTFKREVKKILNWNMSNGHWVDADFSGLKNLHEKFSSSNMQRCKFIGSELSGLELKNNHIDSCHFSGSDLSGCRIRTSHLVNNVFVGSSLKNAEITGTHIKGCDLPDADFDGATFRSSGIEKCLLTGTMWRNTSFVTSHFDEIIFDCNLEDCSFDNCAFSKVTFQNATIINTFFKCKRLSKIKFIDCKADRLTYEFLKNGKADLNGITLIS